MYAWEHLSTHGDVRFLVLSIGSLVGLSVGPQMPHHDGIVIARRLDMEMLVWIAVIVALVALDAGALRWGADSRDPMPDDHRR